MQPRRPRKKRGASRRAGMSWVPIVIVGVGAVAVVAAVAILSSLLSGSGSSEIVIPPTIGERTAWQEGLVLGEEDAPVTIVEYFSFTCPHCADFALDTAPRIEKEFIESKSVRFELRAMAAEGDSLDAAAAAACAGEQGRYYDYHDVLFANFREDSGGAYDGDRLKEYASRLGLDTAAFNSCLDSRKYRDEILAETQEVVGVGLQSTPNFFIGLTREMKVEKAPYPGQINVIGAQPYEAFKAKIEEVLAKAQ